jgi:hypothetical protein
MLGTVIEPPRGIPWGGGGGGAWGGGGGGAWGGDWCGGAWCLGGGGGGDDDPWHFWRAAGLGLG